MTQVALRHRRAVFMCFAAISVVWAAGSAGRVLANPSVEPASASAEAATQIDARELVRQGDAALLDADSAGNLAVSTEYFRKATELGHPGGMRRYGEALILGRGVAADPARGRELVRAAAGLNDTSALMLLAEDAALGRNGASRRAEAIALYEKAAGLGRSVALIKLAQIYAAGDIVPADPAKAAAYYRQAIAGGRQDALVALGSGLVTGQLGGPASRAEGLSLLDQAVQLGNPDAVVALADLHLRGLGVRRDPAKALDMLRRAWEAGNPSAGVKLLSIYRDGVKATVKPDRFLANFYFRQVLKKLNPNDRLVQETLYKASSARSDADFQSIQESIAGAVGRSRPLMLRKIRSINANAYVYLVQLRLRELDFLEDRPSGILSRNTIQAIQKYCASMSSTEKCRKGPLTAGAAETLSTAF